MTGTDASTPGSPPTPPEDVRARLSHLRGRLERLEELLHEPLPERRLAELRLAELLPERRLAELVPERRSRPLWHWYTELRDDDRADSDRPWVKVPPIIERAPLALEDWTASFGRRLRLDRGQGLPPGPEAYRRVPGSSEKAGGVGSDAAKSDAAESDAAESDAAESDAAESDAAESGMAESGMALPDAAVSSGPATEMAANVATGMVPGAPGAPAIRRRVALGLPGIWEDWRHLHVWARELHDAGWDVHLLESLGDMTAPVPDLAERVAEHLHLHDLHDVVLFAHSKGGLVGKTVMLGPEGDRVRGLIACATPFNGAPITQLLPTPELAELSPRSPTITELGADQAVNSRIIQVEAEWDQSVPPSPLEGVRHVTLPITGHSAMLSSPEVARTLVVLARQLVDRGGTVSRGRAGEGESTSTSTSTSLVPQDLALGQNTGNRPHRGGEPGTGSEGDGF